MESLLAPRAQAHVDKVLILAFVVLSLLVLVILAALWNYCSRSSRRYFDSYFGRDSRPHDVENSATPGSAPRTPSNPWSAFVSNLGSAFRTNDRNNDTGIELTTLGAPPAAILTADHPLPRQPDFVVETPRSPPNLSAHLDKYFNSSGSLRATVAANDEYTPLLDHGLRDPTPHRGRGRGFWIDRQLEKLDGGSGGVKRVDLVVGHGPAGGGKGVVVKGIGEGAWSALLERRRRRAGKRE